MLRGGGVADDVMMIIASGHSGQALYVQVSQLVLADVHLRTICLVVRVIFFGRGSSLKTPPGVALVPRGDRTTFTYVESSQVAPRICLDDQDCQVVRVGRPAWDGKQSGVCELFEVVVVIYR